MAFALTIQILLAQISMPALKHDREESKLVVFGQSGHEREKDVAAFVSNAEPKNRRLAHAPLQRHYWDVRDQSEQGRGVIGRYRKFLPVTDTTPVVSLGEGNTPLVFSPRLSEIVGRGCEVFLKCEGQNPTGSFKDRGMTVAVSKAAESGAALLLCASTGNTSASAAAYAARAGLRCGVVLPAGRIARGKLLQAVVYGATIVAIEGNFDAALRVVRKLGERRDVAVVNSINPDRIAGQQTAAFEIVDSLGNAPAIHLLPLGNAGNITAYWAGYRAYRDASKSTRLPVMIGFQAAGAAPIFHDKVVSEPETVASAIRIGNPASWKRATQALKESQGAVDIVSDDEILEAQRWLARHEGIFVEPASAAPIAGLFKSCDPLRKPAYSFANIPAGSRIVCTLTGHGLKDPDVLSEKTEEKTIPPNEREVLEALGL
jgi:threonine synthase